MSNYATLKAAIQAVIYENGNQEITGEVMQATLLSMVNSLGANFQYAGIATPTTNPGTPDQNVFYLAATAGTYANFGNIVLAENEIAILKYNGAWAKDSTGLASAEIVNQLSQKVGDDFGYSDIDISGIERIKYNINTQKKWELSSTVEAVLIPAVPGRGYKLLSYDASYYAVLAENQPAASGTLVDFATGYSGRIITEANEEVEFIAPNDAQAIYIAVKSSSGLKAWQVSQKAPLSDSIALIQEDLTTVQEDVKEIADEISAIQRKTVKLYMGTLLQKGYGTTGPGSALNTRVCVGSVVAVPYPGVTLHFNCSDPEIGFGIRHGAEATNLNTNSYWFRGGDTFTLPENSRYLIIAMAKGTGTTLNSPITVAEIRTLIDSGELSITYAGTETDGIVDIQRDQERYIRAVKRPFTSTKSENSNPDRLPVIVHTSDIHGDDVRLNRFLDFADYIKADAALITGDIVARTGNNGLTFADDAIAAHSSLALMCIGNHDSYGTNNTIAAMAAVLANNISASEAVTDPQAAATYYYKDIVSKNLRVIVLNERDSEHLAGTYSAYYSQRQIDWLITVLNSTPAGYGVIVAFHSPETTIAKVDGYGKFFQDNVTYNSKQSGNITGVPIASIIEAFINKTTLSKTFTETDEQGTATITISADFTGRESTAEFICFINGHEHSDRIGYVSGFDTRMLNLNITCGIALYGPATYTNMAGMSDCPRGGIGATQDAFNLYAIDRAAKTVRVARIGSNITADLNVRDYMAIPY